MTIFVVYAPPSNYDEEEVEAFYINLEKFYREDHTFFKVITGDFMPRLDEEERLRNATLGPTDAVVDEIDEECHRLIQHLHVSAMKAESSKVTKRSLPQKTIQLIRQRVIARAADKRQLTYELGKQCRQAIKEDLKERRAAVMVEAAEAGKSIRKARRSFANCKTKMIALRRPDGTITASRKAMEKIIRDYYSDLFDSHVHLPSYKIKEDGYAVPPVLPSEIRHAISSVKNRTAPDFGLLHLAEKLNYIVFLEFHWKVITSPTIEPVVFVYHKDVRKGNQI
uniref:PHM7_cyt domain-containing protein n=1 Tax=Angiostrongylus cantonensis TaxID=6313 RepID=A0A0K0DPN1_ANGCA